MSRAPLASATPRSPQPALALLRPRGDLFASAHPVPQDVLLVVEVADTLQRYDREVKVPLYARSSVPEVWLVDLEPETVEAHRAPSSDGYQETQRPGREQAITCRGLPDLSLLVREIFG